MERNKHINRLMLVLALSVMMACNLPRAGSSSDLAVSGQTAVDGLDSIQPNNIPEHLMEEDAVRDGSEFDPNRYFDVLTHLSMADGYVLDYVYFYDFMGGYPLLYARQESSTPFINTTELWTAYPTGPESYLDYVEVDGSDQGYLELAILSIMGRQFYLNWHSNYNDTTPVFTEDALEDILTNLESWSVEIPTDVIRQARQLDLNPSVTTDSNSVKVEFITFTKWGGFYREVFTIQVDFPHTFEVDAENLIEYDCGIMF